MPVCTKRIQCDNQLSVLQTKEKVSVNALQRVFIGTLIPPLQSPKPGDVDFMVFTVKSTKFHRYNSYSRTIADYRRHVTENIEPSSVTGSPAGIPLHCVRAHWLQWREKKGGWRRKRKKGVGGRSSCNRDC